MAKANFTLPNGTVVNIEGTPEEIRNLLSFYSPGAHTQRLKGKTAIKVKGSPNHKPDVSEEADISEIVNQIKNCEEADAIEGNILDRTSVVDRTLLPLYIVHEYFQSAIGLTSGDISKITSELGVPVATPNVANTLSKTASRYVVGDKIRKQGVPVRYKISRRGLTYIKAVIQGKPDGK